MKTLKILFLAVMVMSLNTSCSAKNKQKKTSEKVTKADKVEVYYFHFSRRCTTCKAVESVSQQAITEIYGDKVTFVGYNLDEESGKAKGDELKVSGQTLLIVSGDTKINLTNEGFMYARSNPAKLREILKNKIDPLL